MAEPHLPEGCVKGDTFWRGEERKERPKCMRELPNNVRRTRCPESQAEHAMTRSDRLRSFALQIDGPTAGA
jgi:hypothetical protein